MEKKSDLFSVRSMIFTAIMAALICIAAPFSVPIGLVPISLATFAVYLAGGLLGAKRGALAVVVYILIGAVGLPVFSGFAGGFAKLLGVTGGYIIGYVPCALLSGLLYDRTRCVWTLPVGMVLGTLACYIFGTAWFLIATADGAITGASVVSALMMCVVPFLPGDAIKIAAACALAMPLRARLGAYLDSGSKKGAAR